MEGKKILIIEDDADMMEAVEIVLKSKNYTTVRAFNTDEGWAKIKEEKPDMVILDVMFGQNKGTKGFDLAIKMRHDKDVSYIPVLMLTAVNLEYSGFNFSPDTDGEYLPIDEFIDKPAQPDELLSKVEKLLKQRTSEWADWPDKKPAGGEAAEK